MGHGQGDLLRRTLELGDKASDAMNIGMVDVDNDNKGTGFICPELVPNQRDKERHRCLMI